MPNPRGSTQLLGPNLLPTNQLWEIVFWLRKVAAGFDAQIGGPRSYFVDHDAIYCGPPVNDQAREFLAGQVMAHIDAQGYWKQEDPDA